MAQRLTDRVKNIFTLNEAGRFLNFGYGWGIDAPGLKLPPAELNQARHHVVLAHGLAVQAIRANGRAGTKVGPAENIAACLPAIDTPENIRAAEIATRAGVSTPLPKNLADEGLTQLNERLDRVERALEGPRHAARAGLPVDEIIRVVDTVVMRADPEPAMV